MSQFSPSLRVIPVTLVSYLSCWISMGWTPRRSRGASPCRRVSAVHGARCRGCPSNALKQRMFERLKTLDNKHVPRAAQSCSTRVLMHISLVGNPELSLLWEDRARAERVVLGLLSLKNHRASRNQGETPTHHQCGSRCAALSAHPVFVLTVMAR